MMRPTLSSAATPHVNSYDHALKGTAIDSGFLPVASWGLNGLQGSRAVRPSDGLRLPPAFIRLGLAEWVVNSDSEDKPSGMRQPILVTNTGVLISGFAEWHAAVSASQTEIDCIEVVLNDDEALQLLLALHRPRPGWNAFTRTVIALQQEQHFKSRALANQSVGGKHKASAILPRDEHIDVREQIGNIAGVSARNVSKVKEILTKAHPRLIEALRNGTVTINRGLQVSRLPKTEQVEALAHLFWSRSSGKTTRQAVDKLRVERLSANFGAFLTALLHFESSKPGSVEVRPGTRSRTVILVGKHHWNDLKGAIEV